MGRFKRTPVIGKSSGRGHSGSRGSDRGGPREFDMKDHDGPKGKRRFDRSGPGRRAPGREPRGFKNRRDLEVTTVTCASCGEKCDVPFKPTSDKPVYCRDCFAKQDRRSSSSDRRSFDKPPASGVTKSDIEWINKKLDKIMKALDID